MLPPSTPHTLPVTKEARLEARLGRKDRALEAGRALIAAAPGNPESYSVFADLCFQLLPHGDNRGAEFLLAGRNELRLRHHGLDRDGCAVFQHGFVEFALVEL